jgi:hypothetical protein
VTTDADQEELAEFCAALPTLRKLLKGPVSANRRAAVEQAVVAARQGRPIGALLGALRFRDVTVAVEEAGQPARGTPDGTTLPMVSGAASGPVAGVYVCPRGVCRRVEVRGAGGELPACAVHDQALRFVADD